jgi:hypothetical protein
MKALLDDGFRKIETGVKVSTIGMNVQHNLALMKNIDPFQPQRQYASAVNTTNSLVGNTRYVTPKMLAPRQKTKTGSLVPLDEDNSDIKEIIQVNNNNNINKHDDDNYLEITSKPVQDDNFNNHLPQKPQYRNTTTSNTHIANTNIDDTKNFDKIEYRTADGSIYIPQIKKEAKQTKVASLNFDTHTDNISIPQSYTRKGVWSVQVGAFSGKKAAYQYISTLKNKYNKQLSGGKEMVVAFNSGKSIFYRARFEGYTPNKAQSICSFLVSERKKCVALKGVN